MTRTALILIDMQNSFLHPDGENYYPAAPEVIAPCLDLLEAAQKNGAIIVHVCDRHRDGFADFEQPRLPVHCVMGGFSAEFFEGFGPKGRATEILITKRRYSAFFATDLALFLHEQGVKRVVIAGVKTNVCVRATATDAMGNGFEVNVVGPAVNTNRENLGAASLEDIDRYIGKVVDLEAGKALLA
tara:strand:- start:878 stop:1435 length:558 start_codon:yes stop_codon:yes gene_type:complete